MKILIAGDFCPKDRVTTILGSSQQKEILKDVAPIVKRCDLSIVNLECPLFDIEAKPILKQGPNLKGNPIACELLQDCGFKLVTLANNHILDYGEEGIKQTIVTLDKIKLNYVGVGTNLQKASQIHCYEKNNQKIAIINCCEHEFSIASDDTAGANPLNPINQWYAINEAKKKADYILVIVHGGHEHYSLPSPRMQATYRFFIDAGADAIINHHQHCYSGYKIYKERPIFYGLGNFCFDWDGKRDSGWNYGYMVELHIDRKIDFTIYPYEQCNHTPYVKLLQAEKRKRIIDDIQQLNTIIASPTLLKKEHETWMTKDERDWLISLTPFTNRYIQALMRRKYIPVSISKQKVIALLNKIACESHNDKLQYILKEQIR